MISVSLIAYLLRPAFRVHALFNKEEKQQRGNTSTSLINNLLT